MKVIKLVGAAIAVLIVAALLFYGWAAYAASRKLSRGYAIHMVDFPIPASGDARSQALDRGRHLVESRYGCGECHGSAFGGGVMIDDPTIGRLLGPNLTTGKGSVTAGFQPADWDRIVRHGVKPNGKPALMPSEDFRQMSDQELSDIIVFIRSQPSVDSTAEGTTPSTGMPSARSEPRAVSTRVPLDTASRMPRSGVTGSLGMPL